MQLGKKATMILIAAKITLIHVEGRHQRSKNDKISNLPKFRTFSTQHEKYPLCNELIANFWYHMKFNSVCGKVAPLFNNQMDHYFNHTFACSNFIFFNVST